MEKRQMTRTTTNVAPTTVKEEDEMTIDLVELFRNVFKNIKLIIFLIVLFGAVGFGYTKFMIAPTYTASTSIYLTPQVNESGSLDYNSQMSNCPTQN